VIIEKVNAIKSADGDELPAEIPVAGCDVCKRC
jgi:hypothetical protein